MDGGLSGAGRGGEGDSHLDAGSNRLGVGAGDGTDPEQAEQVEQAEQAEQRRGRGREAGGAEGEAAPSGLVVAYWSYDYRDHAMGHLTRGLFCSHQARQEKKKSFNWYF